jgi:hypothetical protein
LYSYLLKYNGMIFLVVLCEAALLFIQQAHLQKNLLFHTQKKCFDNEMP